MFANLHDELARLTRLRVERRESAKYWFIKLPAIGRAREARTQFVAFVAGLRAASRTVAVVLLADDDRLECRVIKEDEELDLAFFSRHLDEGSWALFFEDKGVPLSTVGMTETPLIPTDAADANRRLAGANARVGLWSERDGHEFWVAERANADVSGGPSGVQHKLL